MEYLAIILSRIELFIGIVTIFGILFIGIVTILGIPFIYFDNDVE